jgi:uncharacterized protein (TIGR03437 family)
MRSLVIVSVLAAATLWGQAGPAEQALSWQPVGTPSVDLQLAGPAGGPVSEVYFSQDGSRLFAVTARGAVWSSLDLGATWHPAPSREVVRAQAQPNRPAQPEGLPAGENAARVYSSLDGRFLFALGHHLHRSSDGGRTWVNLTRDGAGSIIGEEQQAIAFSPFDPDSLVVANSRGLWRSADGGLSWSGLNGLLPNLPPARIARVGAGAAPRVLLRGVGAAEWFSNGAWQPALDAAGLAWLQQAASLPAGDQARLSPWPVEMPSGWAASYRVWRGGAPVSPDLTLCGSEVCAQPELHYVTAFAAGAGETHLYVGTSDGRVWTSPDGGLTWRSGMEGLPSGARPVSAIFTDPQEPRSALLAFGGDGSGRLFRTTNGGLFWDDLTADLPAATLQAVAANAETGSIYLATSAGVFYTRGDLRNPSPPTPWTRLAGTLPEGPVEDLKLDRVSGTLYAAVAGHGLYRAIVPDIADSLRLLNSADLTARAAAPGGLLTVMGALVRGARAGDFQAPVLAAADSESQVQVPFEATGSSLSLALETSRGPARLGMPLEEVSPAIFVDSEGAPLLLDAAGGVLLDATRPARAGSQILVLTTGLGRVRPEWPTGLPAPLENPPSAVAPVSAFLSGAPARVLSATLAGGYIGVYMVRLEVPAIVNAGTAELVISAGDKLSNRVTLFLEP